MSLFKEFVDELFKPVGLFKRYAGVFCFLTYRKLRTFVKETEIAYNARQRRFKVMGKIHYKVVLF